MFVWSLVQVERLRSSGGGECIVKALNLDSNRFIFTVIFLPLKPKISHQTSPAYTILIISQPNKRRFSFSIFHRPSHDSHATHFRLDSKTDSVFKIVTSEQIPAMTTHDKYTEVCLPGLKENESPLFFAKFLYLILLETLLEINNNRLRCVLQQGRRHLRVEQSKYFHSKFQPVIRIFFFNLLRKEQ